FFHLRRFRLLLLLFSILFLIGVISLWLHGASELIVDKSLPSSERIDRICKAKREKCFEVIDKTIPDGSDEFVTRSLEVVFPSGSRFIESTVRIQPRKHNVTFSESDTRLWSVDGETLPTVYLRAMGVMPFLSRVIRVGRRKEQKKIALVGVGGGSILSHLRNLRDGFDFTVVEKESEVIELSRRWFELRDATVVNEDGVDWMRRRDGNETGFDVVFLDACERHSAQHCPDPSFTSKENVKNLHQLMRSDTRALVVINFEIYNARKWEMLHEQMGVLLSFFPHCISIDMKERVNMVVGCLTKPLPFHNPENPRASLDASMGFIADQYMEAEYELQYGNIFKEFAVHAIIDGQRESITHPVDKILTRN
ncbi:hypothetical protein PFISCL1PPCAC_24037, partial [Pristionchus fissidentatus]